MSERNSVLKWILIAFVEIEMLFFSGMIYGINSLYPMLTELKYFCIFNNASNPCSEQKLYLSYLFVTITVSTTFFAIPIGLIMDHLGATATKATCAVTSLLGFFFFALSSTVNHYLSFLACVLLGYFTYACMMGNFALATIFPRYQSTIVSVFSCSFDFSCVVMTMIALCYKGGITLAQSMITLAVSCFLLCTISGILNQIIKYRANSTEASETEVQEQPSNSGNRNQIIKNRANSAEAEVLEVQEEPGNLNQDMSSEAYLEAQIINKFPTLRSVLLSRYYIIHNMYLSILCLSTNFFLAQLNIQLHHLFPNSIILIENLLLNSNYVLAIGLVLAPFPGIFLDFLKKRNMKNLLACSETERYNRYLTSFTFFFVVCSLLSQLMFLLILFPYKESVYCSYALLMIIRVVLFSTNSVYLLNAFPKRFFGQLLGIAFFIAGIFSFIQYGIVFDDPFRLNIVHYCIIALNCVSYIHPILLNVNFGAVPLEAEYSDKSRLVR